MTEAISETVDAEHDDAGCQLCDLREDIVEFVLSQMHENENDIGLCLQALVAAAGEMVGISYRDPVLFEALLSSATKGFIKVAREAFSDSPEVNLHPFEDDAPISTIN